MTNLVWFRNDLRINDNTSLNKAAQGERVIAVYFFDPRQFVIGDFGFRKTEKFRARFLIETVAELKANLEKLNITLLVFQKSQNSYFQNWSRSIKSNLFFHKKNGRGMRILCV